MTHRRVVRGRRGRGDTWPSTPQSLGPRGSQGRGGSLPGGSTAKTEHVSDGHEDWRAFSFLSSFPFRGCRAWAPTLRRASSFWRGMSGRYAPRPGIAGPIDARRHDGSGDPGHSAANQDDRSGRAAKPSRSQPITGRHVLTRPPSAPTRRRVGRAHPENYGRETPSSLAATGSTAAHRRRDRRHPREPGLPTRRGKLSRPAPHRGRRQRTTSPRCLVPARR